MNLMSRLIAFLLIVAVVTLSNSCIVMNVNGQSAWTSVGEFKHSDSEGIIIDTVDDFIAFGWSGNGTESDPFALENQLLGSTETYGYIQIRNTSCYFVIKNCQLLLMDVSFSFLSNGRIEDCTFTNSSVSIYTCSDCVLIRNEFSNNNYWETIFMIKTSGCEIRQNHLSYGFDGIHILQCNNTIISDNTFAEFTHGAISADLSNTSITNNVFDNTGIIIYYWDSRIAHSPPAMENNSVNGRDIGFFYNIAEAQIEADLYGQIILGNCTEITVVGGTFVACATGIQFLSCTNCTVDGTGISNCWQGICVESSAGTRIVDCNVSNCLEEAVFLSSSPFYRIENCTLENNLCGFSPHIYSNNGTVANCTIRGAGSIYYGVGIYLSNNSTAIGNTITENYFGIFIYGAYCLVVQNTITYNEFGIYIGEAYAGYGERPYGNRIYGNDIGWNYHKNAYDEGRGYNEWDDGVSIGNSWSDYYGIGYYQISYDCVDHFPSYLPRGGIPLFFIHLGVGIFSSIIIAILLIIALKRHGATVFRHMQNTSLLNSTRTQFQCDSYVGSCYNSISSDECPPQRDHCSTDRSLNSLPITNML